MDPIAVERHIWINAPRERVWQAVTDPKQLSQWYATYYHWEIPALHVGATVTFYNKDNRQDAQVATIEVLNPPQEFTVRWQPHAEYPAVSLVTSFLLSDERGGTRATIRESGYEGVPEDERQQWLDATGGGYAMSMENLQAFVEGRAIPH
jgi:uncharacterized protein YndB with AHSA1/START domain